MDSRICLSLKAMVILKNMKAVIRRQDIPGLVVIATIGLALTFLGSAKLKNAAEAKRWPITIGTVTSSEVAGAMKYYPSVNYTYTIDTVVYTSNSISNMNFNSKNRSFVEDFIKKYPLGSEIKVYYNSADPSRALLEPGINTGHILLLAFGIIILAIPIFLVLFMKLELKKVSDTQ
jgi:hypothetical protein